jgi:hypothetical protein
MSAGLEVVDVATAASGHAVYGLLGRGLVVRHSVFEGIFCRPRSHIAS